jgi:hypothetical protein
MATPIHADLRHLTQFLQDVHRLIDSGQADHGELSGDLLVDFLGSGVVMARDHGLEDGDPLRGQPVALLSQLLSDVIYFLLVRILDNHFL